MRGLFVVLHQRVSISRGAASYSSARVGRNPRVAVLLACWHVRLENFTPIQQFQYTHEHCFVRRKLGHSRETCSLPFDKHHLFCDGKRCTLSTGGRLDESAAWEEKAAELDANHLDSWREEVAASLTASAWGGSSSALDQVRIQSNISLGLLAIARQLAELLGRALLGSIVNGKAVFRTMNVKA